MTYDPNNNDGYDFVTKNDLNQQRVEGVKTWLERTYFDVVPEHRPVSGTAQEVWNEYVSAQPEEKRQHLVRELTSHHAGEHVSEALFHVRDEVNRRVRAAGRPVSREQDTTDRGRESSDEDRERRIREEQEQFLKSKQQPPR